MENKKKKVYYISDIAKAYQNYEESTIDMAGHIAETSILAIATAATIWLPLLLKTNPDMSNIDKCKSLLYGIGVPSITIPLLVNRIKCLVADIKDRRSNAKFIDENRRDITDEEIIEYIEGDGIHKMVKTMNK